MPLAEPSELNLQAEHEAPEGIPEPELFVFLTEVGCPILCLHFITPIAASHAAGDISAAAGVLVTCWPLVGRQAECRSVCVCMRVCACACMCECSVSA